MAQEKLRARRSADAADRPSGGPRSPPRTKSRWDLVRLHRRDLGRVARYVYLACRGGFHLSRVWTTGGADYAGLYVDFGLLLALYAYEVACAALFGVSTLYKWSYNHFLEHHLPLVAVGALMLQQCSATQGAALMQHDAWAALVLLVGSNEALASACVAFPRIVTDRMIRWKRVATIFWCMLMLVVELRSWWRATRRQYAYRESTMWFPTLLTQFLLFAAVIHVEYIKGCLRSTLRRPTQAA